MENEQPQGFVETVYGRVPGCPICGEIPLAKAHVCEHGVTPALKLEINLSTEIFDPDLYRRLVYAARGEVYP